jgi:rare lipoprotein A
MGKYYQPLPHAQGFRQQGIASWYGKKFHGRKTANGEIYNMYAISAAHKTLPLGTRVRVHNMNNNKEIMVRINDRGPFVHGRIIDLSYTAAKKLGIIGPGTAPVEIVALADVTNPEAGSRVSPEYAPVDYYTGNFTFQVGAFANPKNAERLKNKLALKYKNVHITTCKNGYETLYRLRVGKCSTLEEAARYEKILAHDGFENAFTVAE